MKILVTILSEIAAFFGLFKKLKDLVPLSISVKPSPDTKTVIIVLTFQDLTPLEDIVLDYLANQLNKIEHVTKVTVTGNLITIIVEL